MPNQDEELRDIIVKHTSEMLDNPDDCGIYPTTKFYNNLISVIKQWAMRDTNFPHKDCVEFSKKRCWCINDFVESIRQRIEEG